MSRALKAVRRGLGDAEVRGIDHFGVREDGGALDRVAQLAQVAWPSVLGDGALGGLGEAEVVPVLPLRQGRFDCARAGIQARVRGSARNQSVLSGPRRRCTLLPPLPQRPRPGSRPSLRQLEDPQGA